MRQTFGAGARFLRAAAIATGVGLLLAFCAALSGVPGGGLGAPHALAVEKGLVDLRLERSLAGSSERRTLLREIGPQLGTRWVRLVVSWARLEPTRGEYDPAEVARLDSLVNDLRAVRVKVLLTTCDLPTWAQDSRWWSKPPAGYPAGPHPFFAIKASALSSYGELAEFLARHFAGRVRYLECWNEPNLWAYIYPQRTPGDAHFAARTYLRMLRAFHLGVERAHTRTFVVAGSTAPNGRNDTLGTSPRDFALFLKRHGAARYFDVYSHHPYTPGGTVRSSPTDSPNDSSATVVISNLSVLLRIFPGKPFFLTEYGYNTRPSMYYGWFAVSPRQQAAYLRNAFTYLHRYPRVKVLIWYLVQDARGATAGTGIYTGLRDADGTRKPSWYAFRNVR